MTGALSNIVTFSRKLKLSFPLLKNRKHAQRIVYLADCNQSEQKQLCSNFCSDWLLCRRKGLYEYFIHVVQMKIVLF